MKTIAFVMFALGFALSSGTAIAATPKFPQSTAPSLIQKVQKCKTYVCCINECGRRGGSDCVGYCGGKRPR